MSNKSNKELITGIILGFNEEDIEIPKELNDFLSKDDQGIEGLDFMIRDSKLYKRIPKEVSIQYHALYANMDIMLDEGIKKLRKILDEMESNSKEVIHYMIQEIYEEEK